MVQKFLDNFVRENQKKYTEFFDVVVNNILPDLVSQNKIDEAQTQQIRFWMIGALIQIVQSDDFCYQWSDQERAQFKSYLLDWF